MRCRICGAETEQFLDLGRQPIANNFLVRTEGEPFYNLKIFFCPDCFTVQTGDCPDPAKVFDENYAFFTGTSNFMTRHFCSVAAMIRRRFFPDDGLIVEIGSNDGTFIDNFRYNNHIGFDPAENVTRLAREKGLNCLPCCFDECAVSFCINRYNCKANVIFSANVFAHIPDRNSVLENIKTLLAPSGVWISEEPYLKNTMIQAAYDQFYNEHVFYSTLASMAAALRRHDLDIFDFEEVWTHGGSIRFYAGHRKGRSNEWLEDAIRKEGLNDIQKFEVFGKRVVRFAADFKEMLVDIGRPLVGYGASAKSSTVLNFCNIGPELIERIYDTSTSKVGKVSPGMHIPVWPYERFKNDNPKDVVLFIWNHVKEVLEKERSVECRWYLPVRSFL